MGNDFEYRKYKPGDETGIVALLKKSFPKWSRRSVEYWKWKYLDSPLGLYVYLTLDGYKIISVICDVPLRIKLGDKIINGVYSDDTATDPDYRGRGIYTKLYKFWEDDHINREVYFTYWETENPIITKVSSGSAHIPFPFSLRLMIKVKDVNKYLKNSDRDTLKNKLGLALLKSYNSLVNSTPFHKKTKQNFSINTVKDFDDRIDVFWDRIKVDYNFILEKKQGYLNWRYCTYDSDQYQIRLATKDDEVLGYSALQYRKYDVNSEGSITDLLALTERPDVAESLIDDALTQFELLGANSVYCQMIRGHPYQKLLAKRGFIDVTRASKNLLYYNPLNKPGFNPETFSNYSPKSIYFNFY